MIFVNNLNSFLELVNDKSLAMVGLSLKHPKRSKIHEGHIQTIEKLKDYDADLKVVMTVDEPAMKNIIFKTKNKTTKIVNVKYMKKTLEKTGIDIFYYSDQDDFKNNWLSKVNLNEIKQVVNDAIINDNLFHQFTFWYITSLIIDKLFYRKYWIGSNKDGIQRTMVRKFCDKYTRTKKIIVESVLMQDGKPLSSTYLSNLIQYRKTMRQL